MMNVVDWILIAVIGVAFLRAVRKCVRDAKSGRSSCGNCAGCAGGGCVGCRNDAAIGNQKSKQPANG
ncbi:MAG: FeoB-associated Cys-rich membrane protein [Lachnospiraceae bacterium]|nr:FeoB-associated Cys-rich membrane protein [Lachnospiraceae bacterium]